MQPLRVITQTEVTPMDCLASTAYLMEAMQKGRTQGAPILIITRPETDALILGRFQRPSSALKLDACEAEGVPRLRRLTGGSTAMLGAGRLHLALVLKNRNSPLECEPRQFLQRYGAGVIRALSQLGLKARYHGKDLVSAEDRPIGVMSFELYPDGPALLEVSLGVTSPWHPEPALVAYPPRAKDESSAARPSSLAQELAEDGLSGLDSCLVEAYAELLEATPEQREFTPLETARITSLHHRVEVVEDSHDKRPAYLKAWDSRLVEEAIGFVEASVRLTQGRFIRDVRIYGDFMADTAGMEDLQEKLKMVPVKRRPVALVIDDVLGAPEHVIMGIRRLGSILEAILDASRRASEEGVTSKKKG